MAATLVRLDVYRTAIPMRSFEHASAARDVAEAIVVRAGFSDGGEGWGETLPRDYVTGETLDTVTSDLENVLWPACKGREFGGLQSIDDIPLADPSGRAIPAAACALRLAAEGRLIGEPGVWPPGDKRRAIGRVSGVLGSSDPARTARRLRLMRWFGLRDFKLKLGLGEAVDRENLRLVHRRLGRALAAGKCTLRVDVNGGWDRDSTSERVSQLKAYGVCVVEQPVYCGAGELAQLARRCSLPLMADESLVSSRDADVLEAAGGAVWWNIRISKNGGLVAASALAARAAAKGIPFVVGSMVGETSLLSAAQRRLLEICPPPRFVEGNYGRFLLAEDLARPSLRFGYGGRLNRLAGRALGVEIDEAKLARYARLVRTLK